MRINERSSNDTLSQPKMLGPFVPPLRGGTTRRPLALASRWHPTGDTIVRAADFRAFGQSGWPDVTTRIFRRTRIMNSTSLEITRCKNVKVASRTGYIVGLLKTLGVPNRMLYVRRPRHNGSFWLRRIDHLQVLEQARRIYRKKITRVHPDKVGGNLERAIQLNQTWYEIERRFRKHGHELW